MKMATKNEISISQSANHLYLVDPLAGISAAKPKPRVKVLGLIGFIVLACWIAFFTLPAGQVIVFVR